ncbi:MAG: N-acetylmuramoyl-L-alanine amidase [Aquificae bacterium]|nr:N-acetylmuramoyl-L-alanine amidase [Aquificota bacterium]
MKYMILVFSFLFLSFSTFSKENISIRASTHKNFFRIVFDLNKNLPFEKIEFTEPPLIILKFKGSNPINVKNFVKNSQYIKNFEIIKSRDDIKIVLELKEKYKYTLFSLKKPYRLVLDIKKEKSQDPIKEIILSSLSKEEKKKTTHKTTTYKDPIKELLTQKLKEDQVVIPVSLKTPKNWKGKKKIIVIDPGHGGKDPGAIANGLREKDVNLIFAKALKKVLEKDPRFKVYLTRYTDRYVSLYKRTIYAMRKNADLFISLHCNSSPSGYGYGTYVYTLNLRGAKSKLARLVEKRENRAVLEYMKVSTNRSVNRILADLAMSTTMTEGLNFAKALKKYLRKANRFQDIDSANFAVLKTPGIPSVLIEIAYITHPRESKLLKSPKFINNFSYQIYQAVVEYFFSKNKKVLTLK